MALRSLESFQTSSIEDDDREARGLSPRNKTNSFESYDSYDEDPDNVYTSKTICVPPRADWVATERPTDVDEARKPHGKGCIETVKFIAMDREALKCRRSPIAASGT
jgi:hypothetical protein